MGEDELSLGKESSFNEAALKMQRIHEIQNVINNLRTNLLRFNYECNKYNFEIVVAELISLISEVWGKLSTTEKETAKGWKQDIIKQLETQPIYTHRNSIGMCGRNDRYIIFNSQAWEDLRTKMFDMEDFAREMLEAHNLSAPNTEQEGGYD